MPSEFSPADRCVAPQPPARWAGVARLAHLAAAGALVAPIWAPQPSRASSLFEAGPVDESRFVLVSAPIGSGERSQLNIYEQVSNRRSCFAVSAGRPSTVDPLLATFDFTGVCSRYIDGNGFSLRVGNSDLGTVYRLMVSRSSNDTLLLAVPTRAGAGPEMVVARTQGAAGGFVKFEMESGWSLKRRHFRGRPLGHVYVYSDSWPGAPGTTAVQPATPTGQAAPASQPPSMPASTSQTPEPPALPLVSPKS
ncbi:MAG: DUF3747 domain-containing protein [Synechococcaceae cyanobacterium]|nr:DUF3747 domain-containing protein [Synechococcaceae cyanobacterium]